MKCTSKLVTIRLVLANSKHGVVIIHVCIIRTLEYCTLNAIVKGHVFWSEQLKCLKWLWSVPDICKCCLNTVDCPKPFQIKSFIEENNFSSDQNHQAGVIVECCWENLGQIWGKWPSRSRF